MVSINREANTDAALLKGIITREAQSRGDDLHQHHVLYSPCWGAPAVRRDSSALQEDGRQKTSDVVDVIAILVRAQYNRKQLLAMDLLTVLSRILKVIST